MATAADQRKNEPLLFIWEVQERDCVGDQVGRVDVFYVVAPDIRAAGDIAEDTVFEGWYISLIRKLGAART